MEKLISSIKLGFEVAYSIFPVEQLWSMLYMDEDKEVLSEEI